jgi:glycosyltransferase involved in cell wall biosynthesis
MERARTDPGGPRVREIVAAPAPAAVIGTVAALTAEKGVDAFVRAAARVRERHPDARWVWIGDGPWRASLERAAAAAGVGDRIAALGFRDDVPWLVRDLSVFVSASDREGLGTAVLEAQALGVPVVATRSGGVEDVIEDGISGRLTTPDALGDAVSAALEDRTAAAAWATVARERVQSFGVDAMVDATLSVYREVISERRAEDSTSP